MIKFMTQAGEVKDIDWQVLVKNGKDYDIVERFPIVGNYSEDDWKNIVGYYYDIDAMDYFDYIYPDDPIEADKYISSITKPNWA